MAWADPITRTMLEQTLSTEKVAALFKIAGGGTDTAAITFTLARGMALVDSYVAKERPNWAAKIATITPSPAVAKEAALAYAEAFAFRRHPEYVRTFGEKRGATGEFDRAEKLCKQLLETIQTLPDWADDAANIVGSFTQGTDTAEDGVGSLTFKDGFGFF